MKIRFTIRGLFLLTTILAILLTFGLWLAKSPLYLVVFLYLLLYFGVFLFLYVFRYRQQLKAARVAWQDHQLARALLKEELASTQAILAAKPLDQPSGDPL